MTDPILTPSECAKLSKIEAKMTPGPWRPDRSGAYVCSDSAPGFGIVMHPRPNDVAPVIELRNNFARMLATIAAQEATIASLREGAKIAEQFIVWARDVAIGGDGDWHDIRERAEATIAELRKELEGRP